MVTRRRVKNRSRYGVYGVFALLIVIAVGLTGGTVAKYVYETGGHNVLAASEFYFTSNLLGEKGSGKEYTLSSSADAISFTLGNNADQLRYSDNAIDYTVKIRKSTDGEEAALPYATGTLAANADSPSVATIDIVTTNNPDFTLEKGVTYVVSATGNAGYTKTLEAKFTISDADGAVNSRVDLPDNECVLLTVWTADRSGSLSVTYPKGLTPDTTDPILAGAGDVPPENWITFTDDTSFSSEHASRTYRFFRTGYSGTPTFTVALENAGA